MTVEVGRGQGGVTPVYLILFLLDATENNIMVKLMPIVIMRKTLAPPEHQQLPHHHPSSFSAQGRGFW
jgi:hypothetical protein